MGSSKSSSSQATTDARVVADGGSVGISGSNNSVTTTDHGLVDKAFSYLAGAESANTDRLQLLLEAGGRVLDSNNQAVAANSQNLQTMLAAKKAEDTPASQQTVLYLAMIAAGAIVIGKVFK